MSPIDSPVLGTFVPDTGDELSWERSFRCVPSVSSRLKLLQNALGLTLTAIPINAIILGLDLESYFHENRDIMEFGIPVLDTRDIRGKPWGRHGLENFTKIRYHHFRIREMAQFENTASWSPSRHNKHGRFNFGRSEWISRTEARDVLEKLFKQPDDQTPEGSNVYRNIILIGHAMNGDLEKLRNEFGFCLRDLGVDFTQIDIQKEAKGLGWSPTKSQPSLTDILDKVGITSPIDLHNSGNDAAYQLLAGLLMAQQTSDPPVETLGSPTVQAIIEEVMDEAWKAGDESFPIHGTFFHCLRCAGHEHDDRKSCNPKKPEVCKRCLGHGSHVTATCNVSTKRLEAVKQQNSKKREWIGRRW
jgi:hypothetical protein